MKFIDCVVPFKTSANHDLFDGHNIFVLTIQQQRNLTDGTEWKSIFFSFHTHFLQRDNLSITGVSCSI